MKTLADLKRDLTIGRKVTLIEAHTGSTPHRSLNIPRYVIHKQGNAVSLSSDPAATSGSWLYFPKAALLEYDGKEFRIYEPGRTPLSEKELAILANKPSRRPENKELVVQDALSDGSTMFYRDQAYFKEQGAFYLFGCSGTTGGKRLDWNTNEIVDESIKGNLSLVYSIE